MSEKEINKRIALIKTKLCSINYLSKVLISCEYDEMNENHYIKIVFARTDLLCANIMYSTQLMQTLDLLRKKLTYSEFQIYTDDCEQLKQKDCISLNIFF